MDDFTTVLAKISIIVIIVICCVGICVSFNRPPKVDLLHQKATTMVCNDEQIIKVKNYVKVCNESGYLKSHCFDVAVTNFCK